MVRNGAAPQTELSSAGLRWIIFDLRYWRLCDLYSVIWLDKRLDLCDEIADAFSRFLRRPIFFAFLIAAFLLRKAGWSSGTKTYG
jgi:hypothetical protein